MLEFRFRVVVFESDLFEHREVGFVVTEFFFQAGGVIDTHRQRKPFQFPRFKLLGAFVDTFVVCLDFGFGVFCDADKATIHSVDEDVDGFHEDSGEDEILISMDLLVGVLLSSAVEFTGTSTLASGK